MNEALSEEEQTRARENWARMTPDVREVVTELVRLGMMDGRRGLARCRVAVAPERLPPLEGAVPYSGTGRELSGRP
jgi:hypothetical protein